MNAKKIVIAGGSGFLGQILTAYFTDRGVQMVVLTRGANEHEKWSELRALERSKPGCLEGCI